MRGDDNDMTDNVIVIGMTLWNIERNHEMTDYDMMTEYGKRMTNQEMKDMKDRICGVIAYDRL